MNHSTANVIETKSFKEEVSEEELVDPVQLRETVLQHYHDSIEDLKGNFRERLQEFFFIQSGGNMVDYPSWKLRPSAHLLSFLNAFRLDDSTSFCTPTATNTISPSIKMQATYSSSVHRNTTITTQSFDKSLRTSLTKIHTNPNRVNKLFNPGIKNEIKQHNQKTSESLFKNKPIPPDAIHNVVNSNSQLDFTQDNIANQVRHESDILNRISQLRKSGLWSINRLPKVYEQPRKKSHWDFLQEEMQWLATDFAQEKKWKRNMARKVSRAVLKYHQEKASKDKRIEKEENIRLRRIASGIAKEIRIFWQQIEKIACYKHQSRQEEQRKKALDLHLNFIVDQTEKYSSWLVEGMKESSVSSPLSSKSSDNDNEFESGKISDDESTIAEEEMHNSHEKYDDELEALRRESEIPIEDLIPQGVINEIKESAKKKERSSSDDAMSDNDDSDEYRASGEEIDDEETIDIEEENDDTNTDHQNEIDQLQRENEMPLSELLKMYGNPSSEAKEDSEVSADDSNKEEDNDVSLNVLVDQHKQSTDTDMEKVPNKELNEAAVTAESLQPKGFTLSTVQVKTNVPFLLKHTLREYQHIGLDWLVTMYSKQLNGILADEMGLGKTIQTISLLAHLACEDGCWGPHLIVVPTSVMLNWELELKKWCPAFKILTYFGSQKERKLKRTGWCKPNAFHVCITSYKLVIQDHQAFKRRKWKYLILDEAQNIKNFKSQRWQILLNFNSQRRLLLTGTPLQNSLMELWSLMHFLMPNIFASHQDFKEWFSNPLSGMIEGSREYSEGIIKRLHTVLRPFLLRRLKSEVELQMPKKYEHVIKCRLSKRQRFLYDEFMARTKTQETIAAGNFLSVINILMQLRKVCNHPDLFELRPTISPFIMGGIVYKTASCVDSILTKDPLDCINLSSWNFCFADNEHNLGVFQSYRSSQLKTPRALIEDITVHSEEVKPNLPINTLSCSLFKSLVDSSKGGCAPAQEVNRSYLDIISSSETTNGCASIGDILTRQIEGCVEGQDVDVVNIIDDDLFLPPASKRRKIEMKQRLLEDYIPADVSPFYIEQLKRNADEMKSCRLSNLAVLNERHCCAKPLYGVDLRRLLHIVEPTQVFYPANGMRYTCSMLNNVIKTPRRRMNERRQITERFSIYVHPVITYPIQIQMFHPQPSKSQHLRNLIRDVTMEVGPRADLLYPLKTLSMIQFPETRLVQYDCGKLQALYELLRQLKVDKHRVLIFTQMTRMLDVLERFLNYHGYIYLRLDGSTKVEQRQILMERFNHDDKIFIFILSTRSGGLGINLTGADTVVFYDSDWNPTMDAQAQDRCHRIGQTRDVHIYRLISDRTVEENILKKAHQKRLLGNIAIEGGNFTTAYFKQDSVSELFNLSDGPNENKQMNNKKEEENTDIAYEKVLCTAEEEEDAQAAARAKAEQDLDMVEFTDANNESSLEKNPNVVSQVEQDLLQLESRLKPIELSALKFLESTDMYQVEDEIEETERKLEQAKKDWELDHLRSLREAEEQKNAELEDEMFFTYVRDDTYDKDYIDECSGAAMSIWTPPTPPQEGVTEYITDPCLGFLYETDTIPENHLPPIHFLKKNGMDLYAIKRDTSRTHYLTVFKKRRMRISKPKSLFDKKALELLTNKNKLKKSQKLKQKAMSAPTPSVNAKPDYSQCGPDWLINEDWALLQTVNTMCELPVDMVGDSTLSRSANWDFAADVVNNSNRSCRTSRQCRDRYQNVIIPREEGKLLVPMSETNEIKTKKTKKVMQQPTKPAAPPHPQPKTHPQFNSDHGRSVVNMHSSKFDSVQKASSKRKPLVKQPKTGKSQTQSGNRYAQILSTNSVSVPLNPKDLATMRAERIAKEKAQAVLTQQLQQQTSTSTITQSQSTISTAAGRTSTVATVGQLVKGTTVGIVQVPNSTGSIRGNLVFTSTSSSVGGNSLVVNPGGVPTTNIVLNTTAASFAAINRKMQVVNQNTASLQSTTSGARILPSASSNAKPNAVVCSSTVVASNLVAHVQRAGTTVPVTAGLITTQPFLQGKALTQQQIAMLRQKAAHQQQQQQQQLLKIQQQRLHQQKQQQLKLMQQQQLQTQTTKANTVPTSSTQLGNLTVQTMKASVTLRGSVSQQIVTQSLTAAQQQQLLQQALKKQQLQQLQQRGQLATSSPIQQMLAGQKLTPQQLQQLQQQQRHSQLQQQLKFQSPQVSGTMVSQPKAQLVMTQVKQGTSTLKTSGQQVQLHQIQQQSAQNPLPQQILLRPTITQTSAQFQGLPQQIQLRAMINQQSTHQRSNAGQQLQAMQAQVNLQTGTVVMQPQQPTSTSAASSLAQQQQRNIQAAVQKQVLQQQQTKITTSNQNTIKAPQVQLHLQHSGPLPAQLQRQQVLSATPAQLSQVKAFVSQAQLQASQSRSNSPVTQSTVQAAATSSIQLQAQQVSHQMRRQAQLVQVQLKTADSSETPKQQPVRMVTKPAVEDTSVVEQQIPNVMTTIGAETELSTGETSSQTDEHALGMRTRTRSQNK